ncbi:MAG: alpha/beta hydrolase [Gammaproteobacteria bacterium]|nr:alpha/beta hydrolase [Gammaproteobacteria bacterium]
MATFVLVHGAWSGAHGFRHVRRLLRAAGHDVYTPSLTGLGERVHLASPLVGLGTHVRDVVNCVLFEDLRDIVLLGYSYGGFVVTGALEHIADHVRELVYLDAFVPGDGETVLSHVHGEGRPAITLAEDWQVVGPARAFDDPAETAWMMPRRVPQPRGCFTEPVQLSRPIEAYPFGRTYIKASHDTGPEPGGAAFWRAARMAAASPAWNYFEIAGNHLLPSNQPDAVVSLLRCIAGE